MKLVLASAGFSTKEIVDKCIGLTAKPKDQIKLAVLNEAYAVEAGGHGWVLDTLNRIRNNFKNNIELVNLLALNLQKIEERIRTADVIFVVGGNPDYLMSVFNKTGFSKLLPDLLEDKVYVGSSAGSMILGRRVSTKAYLQTYGEANNYGTSEYLGLVDLAIEPHFEGGLSSGNLLRVSKGHKGVIYGLRDDSAIVIDGEKQYTIGSEVVKIRDGKLVWI